MKLSMRFCVLSCALSLSMAAGGQFAPVRAELVIPNTVLLPGVPFEAWIQVTNSSDAEATIGLAPTLVAANRVGEPFESTDDAPDFLLPGDGWGSMPEYYLTLRPHEVRMLTLPIADRLAGPAVFSDHRISPPGKYRVAVRLDAWSRFGPPPPEAFAGPITTNHVSIDRIEPTGADAAVWARLQEVAQRAGVQWTSDEWPSNTLILNEILTKFPKSNYVPYALIAGSFGNIHESYLGLTIDAIKRFPHTPVADLLHWKASGVASALGKFDLSDRERAYVEASKRPTTYQVTRGRRPPVSAEKP